VVLPEDGLKIVMKKSEHLDNWYLIDFWSPRNSSEDGVVSVEEADELAEQIFRYFANDRSDK